MNTQSNDMMVSHPTDFGVKWDQKISRAFGEIKWLEDMAKARPDLVDKAVIEILEIKRTLLDILPMGDKRIPEIAKEVMQDKMKAAHLKQEQLESGTLGRDDTERIRGEFDRTSQEIVDIRILLDTSTAPANDSQSEVAA